MLSGQIGDRIARGGRGFGQVETETIGNRRRESLVDVPKMRDGSGPNIRALDLR